MAEKNDAKEELETLISFLGDTRAGKHGPVEDVEIPTEREEDFDYEEGDAFFFGMY